MTANSVSRARFARAIDPVDVDPYRRQSPQERHTLLVSNFFDTASSFEAWETHGHRYLKNRLGIVRARGGGLLDHPYAHVTLHLFPLQRSIW